MEVSSSDFQTDAAALPPDIQLPGKTTLSILARALSRHPYAGPSSLPQHQTANQITATLVSEFLASQHGHLSGSYVLVWTDPVDFILTDSNAREDGYTAARGPISETGGTYNSGAGDLKLVVVPFSGGSYDLDLFGVGEGSVLFGAAMITEAGGLVGAESTQTSTLPTVLASMTDLAIVLAFNNPETTGPGISPAAPPPPDDPGGGSSPPQNPSSPSSPTTSAFSTPTTPTLSAGAYLARRPRSFRPTPARQTRSVRAV